MGEKIRGLFFTDRLRSLVSTIFLILIFGAILGSWMFPKTPKAEIDPKSIELFEKVADKLERAANTFEQQGNNTAALNETLKRQLDLQDQQRTVAYDILYKRWGIDPASPPPGTVVFSDNAPPSSVPAPVPDVYPRSRLQPQAHDLGGKYIPPSEGFGSGNYKLQEPTATHQETLGRSDTRVPGGNSTSTDRTGG